MEQVTQIYLMVYENSIRSRSTIKHLVNDKSLNDLRTVLFECNGSQLKALNVSIDQQ